MLELVARSSCRYFRARCLLHCGEDMSLQRGHRSSSTGFYLFHSSSAHLLSPLVYASDAPSRVETRRRVRGRGDCSIITMAQELTAYSRSFVRREPVMAG